jgi:hypothetical protein
MNREKPAKKFSTPPWSRCLVALPMAIVLSGDLAAESSPRYSIRVEGPVANLAEDCTDPCKLERVRQVGRTSATVEDASNRFESNRINSEPAVRCAGNCVSGQQKSGLSLSMPAELKEGVEVSIEDGVARFVFYRVTDTESGQKTLKQHSRFEVDREFISLKLREHEVEIRVLPAG